MTNPTTAENTKITAGLTAADLENMEVIYRGSTAKNRAQALSMALSLTRFLMDHRNAGDTLILEKPDRTLARVVMKELML